MRRSQVEDLRSEMPERMRECDVGMDTFMHAASG
ncbi:hypothetical protein SAMN05444359_110129 [Neolewinella agarilytica]|uniref:Uncharacterized protein n=1 Tax=Neolewinella agarilytica TaxID=478744 RepID=A0A1H9GCT7_9BACT|nr:hypothetical protein SAMN05444359_110129 [Neolewinella agarilytica]